MAATTPRGAGRLTSHAGGAFGPPDEETQTRFLRELALRLPLDRVVEAHVFPAIRQGGAETGVAVIAVRREEQVGGGRSEVGESSTGATTSDAATADATTSDAATSNATPPESARGAPPHGEVAKSASDTRHPSNAPASGSAPDEQRTAAPPSNADDRDHAADEEPTSDLRPPTSHAPPDRHTVFSARYRLTLKGPDRGKWEVDVVEEADAPLVSIDAVVRGVQRRAGEGADPERISAEQLRTIAAAAPAQPAPDAGRGRR